MRLKPLEAGRYDDDSILIRNPENGKQELFSENEYEIVKFLKKNEEESLLALLLPNIGIAKKDHIVICLKVLSKLKRLQILDYFSITGRKAVSDTGTLEIEPEKQKIQIFGLSAVPAVIFGLWERAFAWMGPSFLFLLNLLGAALVFLFFPFDRVENDMQTSGLSYFSSFIFVYVFSSLAISFRSLMQAAFVRSLDREPSGYGFSIFFPLIVLVFQKREVNLAGSKARIQLSLVGLLSPLAFSSLLVLCCNLGLISISTAFLGVTSGILATLILACPFFTADLADILHVFFLRDELKERISVGLRNVFRTKGSLSREMLFGLIASLVWLIVWLDCIRAFWETVASVVTVDIFSNGGPVVKAGSWLTVIVILTLVFMPAAVFLVGFLQEKFGSKKKRIVIQKDKVKESLSFEERMAALEKIPLFAYLNDQERLSLLNEMYPAFYHHKDYLMHQGEVGREFFVLVKGHANAYFSDVKGRNYLLADLREGDAFGEIALIDDVPRTASIVSDGGCIVLVLKKEGFDRFSHTLGSPDRVKTMIRLTSFFRRHPLLSKLSVKDQAHLIDAFRFETITMGEKIQDNEENFFVIYSGKVRVDVGEDAVETHLLPDDCFGYANPLNAAYFAQEGTGLLTIRREQFHQLIWEKLVEHPELFI